MTIPASNLDRIRQRIPDVPDFPKPGITFKDITPLLGDPEVFGLAIQELRALAEPLRPTHLLCLESRGFIFGSALAQAMGVAFVPARKPGKLPRATVATSYGLEYGTDTLEVHRDAFPPGARVLIVDDVLATGGTALAAIELVRLLDADLVGVLTLLELTFLGGRQRVAAKTACLSLLS